MLSVTIPIFDGGATSATVDEKLALEDQAQDHLMAATRSAGASAREYWSRLRGGVARVESLSRLVQSSRAALDATRVGYRVGSRASTDVLRASEAFFAARRDLIRARYATVVALLQLKAATASLNVEEVARVNQLMVGAAGLAVARDDAPREAIGGNAQASQIAMHSPQAAGDGAVRQMASVAEVRQTPASVEVPRVAARPDAPQPVAVENVQPAATIDAAVQRALASIRQP